MKILALENDVPGVGPERFHLYLKEEARRVWELSQSGVIREVYFRADRTNAVIILECRDAAEAKSVLATLPLVREGLIAFETIPLVPYTGFSRLFSERS